MCSAALQTGIKTVAPAASGNSFYIPPLVDQVISSSGVPLDPESREFFETRFGHDFSQVRVFADERASESARSVNALAYTVGHNVVFGSGRYEPHTTEGRRLLAHELAHVVQQDAGINRQAETIPAGPFQVGSEDARQYVPQLRPRVPRTPEIPPPPVPAPELTPPATCPSAADVVRDIRASDVAGQVEARMQHQINLGRSLSGAGAAVQQTPAMRETANRAIRAEFGRLLPPGRNFTAPASVTTRTPTQFGELRIPDAAAAQRRIGEVALESGRDRVHIVLNDLCIADPNNPTLQAEVASVIFARQGLSFVREYERTRIGGQTFYPSGRFAPHVDLPSESRNMGHIVVHEAIHFYVHENYYNTASSSPVSQQLLEGGAEFLARQVINQRLSSDPAFQINTGTYASEFAYVVDNLVVHRGGLDSFTQAYFQGRVDLLGLTPAHPKLINGQVDDAAESEADRMADLVMRESPATKTVPTASSSSVGPRLQRQEGSQAPSTPHDRMVVEQARRRLALLERFVGEWSAREARRMRTQRELPDLLSRRERMDLEGTDLGPPGARAREEVRNLAGLNRRPLDIQITDQEVRIGIRFHVRFEDPAMANRLSALQGGVQAGLDLVWNQTLSGEVFGGRRLVIAPTFTVVSPTAPRDLNYWLITVRPSDSATNGQVIPFQGCAAQTVPLGAPTSVTDSTCAGGVMSLPPSHITRGGVIGHELLHLFGLVDRYALIESVSPTGRRTVRNDPTRATQGRRDPLGAEDARILPEDVGFLFDRLGIYQMEENRGLAVLRQLEAQGLTIGAVTAEIHRLQETIRLGHDPRSLLPRRGDFTDRMVEGAEHL
jgi:hypothetical protein